jgi:hypothetical protein
VTDLAAEPPADAGVAELIRALDIRVLIDDDRPVAHAVVETAERPERPR